MCSRDATRGPLFRVGCEFRGPRSLSPRTEWDVGVGPEISPWGLNATLDLSSLVSICDTLDAAGHVARSWGIPRLTTTDVPSPLCCWICGKGIGRVKLVGIC